MTGPRSFMIALVILGAAPGPLHAEDAALEAKEVAPGVWVRIVPQDPFQGPNQAWVELSEGTVVIDPGFPVSAENLRGLLEERGAPPVTRVALTHYHGDHADGGGVFQAVGAKLVAARAGRPYFETQSRALFARARDDRRPGYRGELALPDAYLETPMVADGVHYVPVGHGHSAGDMVVWTRDVLFAGDLANNGPFQNFAQANLEQWIEILRELRRLPIRIVVPGHGPPGDPTLLDRTRAYIEALLARARRGIAEGRSVESALAGWVVPEYEAWTGVAAASRSRDLFHAYRFLGAAPPAATGSGCRPLSR